MKPPSGHLWGAFEDARSWETVDVVMHHAKGSSVEPLAPIAAHVGCCAECGLVFARAELPDGEVRRAYGLDLDSLALMGSAPVCKPLVMGAP